MPHQFGDPLLLDLECDVSEPISRCRQALDTIELQFNAQYEAYHHAYTDIAASLITHTLCVVKKTIGDQDYYILDLSQLNLTDGVHIALIDRDEVRQSTVIIGDVIIDANSQLTLFTDYHLALIGQNRQMSRYTLFSEGTVYLNARLEAADGIQLGAQHCILDTHAQLSSEVIHIDIAQTIEINATLLATQLQIRAGQITQKGVLEAQHIILAAQHINHTGETRAGSLIERIAWRYVADEDSCMHTPDYIRSVIMDCSESGHLSCNRYQGQFSQLSVGGRFYCGSGNTHVPDCVILADSVTNTAGSCLMLNTDLSIDANTVIDLTHGNCYTLNALRINWKQILDPTADYDQFEGYAKLALFKPANPKQGLIILSSQIYEQCYPQNKHDLFIQHTHRLKSGGDVGIGRSWHTQNANVNVYAKSTIELTNSVSNATQMGQAHLSLYAQKINVSGQLICSQTRVHMRDPSQTPDATRSQCIQYTKGGNDKSSESYQLEFALNGSFNADTLIVQGMNSYLHPNSCLTVRRAKFILKNEFRIDRARVHADVALIKAKFFYNRFGDLYGDHLVVDAKTILNRGVIDVGNQLYFAQFFISTGVLRASHSIQTNALILLRFGYIKTPYDCVTSLLTLSATLNLNIGFSPNVSLFRKFMILSNALLTLSAFTIPGAALITEIIRIPLNMVPLLLNIINQYPQFKAMFEHNDFDMVKTSVAIERLLMVGTSLVLSFLGGVTLFESLSPERFNVGDIPLDPAHFTGIDSLESFMNCPFVKMTGQLGSALSYLSGRVSTNVLEVDVGAGLCFGDMHYDVVNLRSRLIGSLTGSSTALVNLDFSEGVSLASTSAHGYAAIGNAGVHPLIGTNQQSFNHYALVSDGVPLWLTHIDARHLELRSDLRLIDSSISTHDLNVVHAMALDHSSLTADKLSNHGKLTSHSSTLLVDAIDNTNQCDLNASNIVTKQFSNTGKVIGRGDQLVADSVINTHDATAVFYSSRVHAGGIQDDGALQFIRSHGTLDDVIVSDNGLLAVDGCTFNIKKVSASENTQVAARNSHLLFDAYQSDGNNQFSGSTVKAKLFDISKTAKAEFDYTAFELNKFMALGLFYAQYCTIKTDLFVSPLQHDATQVSPLSGAAGSLSKIYTPDLIDWHIEHVSLQTSHTQVAYADKSWTTNTFNKSLFDNPEAVSTRSPYELALLSDGTLLYLHNGALTISGEHDNYSVVGMRIRSNGMTLKGRTIANANFAYESTRDLDADDIELVGAGSVMLAAHDRLDVCNYTIYSGGTTYLIGDQGVSTQAGVKIVEHDSRERTVFSAVHTHAQLTQIQQSHLVSKADVVIQSQEGRVDVCGTDIMVQNDLLIRADTGASFKGTSGHIHQSQHRIDFLKVTNQTCDDDIYVESTIEAGGDAIIITNEGDIDKTGSHIHTNSNIALVASGDIHSTQVILEHHQSSQSVGIGARVAGIDIAKIGQADYGINAIFHSMVDQDPLYSSFERLSQAGRGLESGVALLNSGMALANTLEHVGSGVRHGNLGQEALARAHLGGANGFDPSIKFTASFHHSTAQQQTVSEGDMSSSNGTIHIQAGGEIQLENGEHIHGDRVELSGTSVTLEGAALHEQHYATGGDLDVDVTLSGLVSGGGIALDYAKGSSVVHTDAAIECHKLQIETDRLDMTNAKIKADTASGHIAHATIQSVQDTVHETSTRLHCNTSGLFGGSFVHRNDAQISMQSDIDVGDATGLAVHDQTLIGAQSDLQASESRQQSLVDQVSDVDLNIELTGLTHTTLTIERPDSQALASDIFRADELQLHGIDSHALVTDSGRHVTGKHKIDVDILVPHYTPPTLSEVVQPTSLRQEHLVNKGVSKTGEVVGYTHHPARIVPDTAADAPLSSRFNPDQVCVAPLQPTILADVRAPLSTHSSDYADPTLANYFRSALDGMEEGIDTLYETFIDHPIDNFVIPVGALFLDVGTVVIVGEIEGYSPYLLEALLPELDAYYQVAKSHLQQNMHSLVESAQTFLRESGLERTHDFFSLGTELLVPESSIRALTLFSEIAPIPIITHPKSFEFYEGVTKIDASKTLLGGLEGDDSQSYLSDRILLDWEHDQALDKAVLAGVQDGLMALYETFIHHPIDNFIKPVTQMAIDTVLIALIEENLFHIADARIPSVRNDYRMAIERMQQRGENIVALFQTFLQERDIHQAHDIAAAMTQMLVPGLLVRGVSKLMSTDAALTSQGRFNEPPFSISKTRSDNPLGPQTGPDVLLNPMTGQPYKGFNELCLDYLYRGTSRVPEDVFENGFSPRGDNDDLLIHKFSNDQIDSAYVATSKAPIVAASFPLDDTDVRFLFRIENLCSGIDINKVLFSDRGLPDYVTDPEHEVAIPHLIYPKHIMGAWRVKINEGNTNEVVRGSGTPIILPGFIKNHHFVPEEKVPIWSVPNNKSSLFLPKEKEIVETSLKIKESKIVIPGTSFRK